MDEARFAALEARIRAAEDELAIIRLLLFDGPRRQRRDREDRGTVDRGRRLRSRRAASRLEGHAALKALYQGPTHQGIIGAGSGHLTLTPTIRVDGDTAEATGHSLLVQKAEDGWKVTRATANHWRLKRTPQGWRVVERVNRLLDGSRESHDIFRIMPL